MAVLGMFLGLTGIWLSPSRFLKARSIAGEVKIHKKMFPKYALTKIHVFFLGVSFEFNCTQLSRT